VNGFIYKIVNQITNQVYVGKTSKGINDRWNAHVYVATNRLSETYLHRSMRQYGLDNFEISILEECSLDNIDDRERHWISQLNSLAPTNFNMTSGGEGGDTSKSPNYIESMKKRDISGDKNPMYGRKRTDTAIYLAAGKQKMLESNRCPVICLGIKYDSVGDAQRALPGISVRKRLDSDRYPEFYRLREKTKRK